MESRVEYRVLAPDSVAWFIQAALTADRSGNVAARDVALAEARRVAAERGRMDGMDGMDRMDGERAEGAYWRECAEYAAEMLARGRETGQDWRQAAMNAESYLRQTLAVDGEQPCYDVAHECNGVRLAELEEQVSIQKQRINGLTERVDELEALQVETDDKLSVLSARIDNSHNALVDQIRAEAQGNIAAFAATDRTCNELDMRLTRVVDVLRERGVPVGVHDGDA